MWNVLPRYLSIHPSLSLPPLSSLEIKYQSLSFPIKSFSFFVVLLSLSHFLFTHFHIPPSLRYDSNASASESSEGGDEVDDEGKAKKTAKKAKIVKEKKERKPRKEVRDRRVDGGVGGGGSRVRRGYEQR